MARSRLYGLLVVNFCFWQILLQKSKIELTPKISRKLIFGHSLPLHRLFSAATKVRGRFWMKRYGPSRRRAQNASAVLKIFVRHPKKTFATLSGVEQT